MRIFDIYTYDLKQIRFKDNKEYFDRLLKELDLAYTDIGFCFRPDFDGSICEKVTKQFESLRQYKRYLAESELHFGSMPEYQMSSVSVDTKGGIHLHIDRDHSEDFGCMLKKVPRPINFGFMGVMLDNVGWDNHSASNPCFGAGTADKIAIDHRFSNYYSNSIRFVKEYDFGNKQNLVEILIERYGDAEKLTPYPEKFAAFCARLGKPMYKRTVCVFGDEENAKLNAAKEDIQRSINENRYADLFAEFKRDYPNTAQQVMASLTAVQGFSPKKVFTSVAKKYGFKYKTCLNGRYELRKINLYNHTVKVSFVLRPFSSLFSADISVCGHNFNLGIAYLSEVVLDNEAQGERYADKVFEVADAIEKEFTDKLYGYFGKTPDWYVERLD